MSGIISREPRSADGLMQNTSIPGVDPNYMCFCQGAKGSPTPANPNVDFTVPEGFVSVQIMGAHATVKNAADFDAISLEVGVDIPGMGWMTISKYAYSLPILSDTTSLFKFDKETMKKSAPIPAGLTMRLIYEFADPENPSTPKVGISYSLEKPYA